MGRQRRVRKKASESRSEQERELWTGLELTDERWVTFGLQYRMSGHCCASQRVAGDRSIRRYSWEWREEWTRVI